MTDDRGAMSMEELAGYVCDGLRRRGISVVLTGGSVVSIHSHNAYVSDDLDFVVEGLGKRLDGPMKELGFRKNEVGRHWTHPRSRFWVEFPAGPLEVGDAPVTNIEVRETPFGELRLLPPTECVMDRLAAFYHWKDGQALVQAVAVATRQAIDLERIRTWSAREGHLDRFEIFLDELGKEGPEV